jgi:hypothetical protein
VPLTKLQSDILRVIASQRTADSYIAGATPLNRDGIRFSSDIDIFHDLEELVHLTASSDAATLETAGFTVHWLRRSPTIQTAEVQWDGSTTRLEWVFDSDFRFFPTLPDPTFGFMLHPIDLAMNKVSAAAGRRALRDLIDLVTVHQSILPLGAIIWATVEKSPGFTPEGLIEEIRRNSHFPRLDWDAIESVTPLDPIVVSRQLREILAEAEAFVAQMPTAKAGLLFLKDGKVVQPDPTHLDEYQTHAGERRGHWPSSPEIAAAMLERIQAADDAE